MAEWIYAASSMFWLGMLIYYSRKWKRTKAKLGDDLFTKCKQLLHEQAARNVSDARLSMIRQIAEQTLKEKGSPYRTAGVSALDTLEKVVGLVNQNMAENYREAGHFQDLQEATAFLDTLPTETNAYVFPARMWDGDCFHVIYAVPESQTEMPPPGTKVRK